MSKNRSTTAPARQWYAAALHSVDLMLEANRITALDWRLFRLLCRWSTRGISHAHNDRLAAELGCNVDTITICFRRLIACGLLVRERRGNVWRTLILTLQAAPDPKVERTRSAHGDLPLSNPLSSDLNDKYAASMARYGGIEQALVALRC